MTKTYKFTKEQIRKLKPQLNDESVFSIHLKGTESQKIKKRLTYCFPKEDGWKFRVYLQNVRSFNSSFIKDNKLKVHVTQAPIYYEYRGMVRSSNYIQFVPDVPLIQEMEDLITMGWNIRNDGCPKFKYRFEIGGPDKSFIPCPNICWDKSDIESFKKEFVKRMAYVTLRDG